jgi:hypothetical protein
LAIRGVPREREAISAVPPASDSTPSSPAERRMIERDRGRAWPLADHDVDPEVLHREVEHLLGRPRHPVQLVDEQHVAVVQPGQDRGEVAGVGDRGAAGQAHRGRHLGGDDHRQRGLAEAGRAVEQHMVERLAAGAGGLNEHRQVLARGLLADEFGESLGTQVGLGRILLATNRGDGAGLVAHPGAFCASSFRLSRITASSGAASPSRSIVRATIGCASCRR